MNVRTGIDAIDVFCHCLPPAFVKAANASLMKPLPMFQRASELPGMSDVNERLEALDSFGGYQQILSLASPAVEAMAGPGQSPELARTGNDAMAEWCRHFPGRFPGFVASLPLNNPDAALKEAQRAFDELGAVGIQLYTNVNGQPIDRPEYLQIFELMAELDHPIWLHPLRSSSVSDYPDSGETVSKYDLWWALGWPHETSVCAGRLVFAGVFDKWPNLKIITHHAGGTLPMMEGRLDAGLKLLGTRYAPEQAEAAQTELKEKPIDAFRRFYADTATFGSRNGIEYGCRFFGEGKMLFASDYPFAEIGNALDASNFMMKKLLENTLSLLHP